MWDANGHDQGGRMIRRLFRLGASGLCLLSLLACVATGWMWWDARRLRVDRADVAVRRVFVYVSSDDYNGLLVGWTFSWPGPRTAIAWSVADSSGRGKEDASR